MVYLIGSEPEMGQYPSEKFLDGDPKKIKVEGPETEEKLLAINLYYRQQYNAGFRIMSENVPTVWQWNSSRTLPDYYTPHGFPCVSARFKEVVEQFEPGVHQFFPITVVNKTKEKIAQRWLWVVCNRIDGVDRENTTFVLRKGMLWMTNWEEDGQRVEIPNPVLYHSKKQTQDYHFWRDQHIRGGGIYASDEAAEALQASKLSMLRLRHEETV